MKSGMEEAENAPVSHANKALEPRAARPGDQPEERPGGLWDIRGVSRYLKVPVSSIYKMTARKAAVRIPHIRIGGKVRFRQEDIDRWLTLLTVSNLEVLSNMRRKVAEVTHGNDSQTKTPRR